MAKNTGVESVIEHLFSSIYGDYTQIQRGSIPIWQEDERKEK
jgi:hypothetical protein